MPLIALASAKGAPGVTTLTLALACVWPTPTEVVVVDADPTGTALVPRFGLDPDSGVSTLAPMARRRFPPELFDQHLQRLPASLTTAPIDALVGVAGPEQSRHLGPFWERFAEAMAPDPRVLLVDGGRLFPGSPVAPLIDAAAAVVLVLHPDVESVVHTARRIDALARRVGRESIHLATHGRTPYGLEEVTQSLGVSALGVMESDPETAAILAGAASRRTSLSRSLLLRSAASMQAALGQVLADKGGATPGKAAM